MGVKKRNLGGSKGYRCGNVMERRNMPEAKGLDSGPWTVAWIWVRFVIPPSSLLSSGLLLMASDIPGGGSLVRRDSSRLIRIFAGIESDMIDMVIEMVYSFKYVRMYRNSVV